MAQPTQLAHNPSRSLKPRFSTNPSLPNTLVDGATAGGTIEQDDDYEIQRNSGDIQATWNPVLLNEIKRLLMDYANMFGDMSSVTIPGDTGPIHELTPSKGVGEALAYLFNGLENIESNSILPQWLTMWYGNGVYPVIKDDLKNRVYGDDEILDITGSGIFNVDGDFDIRNYNSNGYTNGWKSIIGAGPVPTVIAFTMTGGAGIADSNAHLLVTPGSPEDVPYVVQVPQSNPSEVFNVDVTPYDTESPTGTFELPLVTKARVRVQGGTAKLPNVRLVEGGVRFRAEDHSVLLFGFGVAADRPPSNEAIVVPPSGSVDAPATPKELAIVAVTTNSVELEWDPVTNGDYYMIQRATSPTGPWTDLVAPNTVTTGSYVDNTPAGPAGTLFFYRVRAVNIVPPSSTVDSPQSGFVYTALLYTAPPEVDWDLPDWVVGVGSIALRWDVELSGHGYRIERYDNVGLIANPSSWETIAFINSAAINSFTDRGLTPNTQYTYRIYPYVVSGGIYQEGDVSDEESMTTLSGPLRSPVLFTSHEVHRNTIRLTWDTVPGAADYVVSVWKRNPDLSESPLTYPPSVSNDYLITGLLASTTYRFNVYARNGSQVSLPSVDLLVTTLPSNSTAGIPSTTIADMNLPLSNGRQVRVLTRRTQTTSANTLVRFNLRMEGSFGAGPLTGGPFAITTRPWAFLSLVPVWSGNSAPTKSQIQAAASAASALNRDVDMVALRDSYDYETKTTSPSPGVVDMDINFTLRIADSRFVGDFDKSGVSLPTLKHNLYAIKISSKDVAIASLLGSDPVYGSRDDPHQSTILVDIPAPATTPFGFQTSFAQPIGTNANYWIIPETVSVTSKQAHLIWPYAPNAFRYEVYRRQGLGAWVSLGVTHNTRFIDPDTLGPGDLSPGVTYDYAVRVEYIQDGSGASGTEISTGSPLDNPTTYQKLQTTTSIGIPDPIIMLPGTTTANTTTLNWQPDPNATQYYVYWSVNEDGPWSLAGFVNDPITTFTHLGLAENQTYHYKVIGKNMTGYGPNPGTPSIALTPRRPVPGSIAGLGYTTFGTGSDSTTIRTTWSPTSGASFYEIQRTRTTLGTRFVQQTSTQFDDTDLPRGTEFQYVVVPANNAGYGTPSSVLNATSQTGSPSMPTNVKQLAKTDLSITVGWDAVPTATSYNVLYAKTQVGPFNSVSTPTNSVTIFDQNDHPFGLDPETIYYVKIIAVSGTEVSAETAPVVINTDPSSINEVDPLASQYIITEDTPNAPMPTIDMNIDLEHGIVTVDPDEVQDGFYWAYYAYKALKVTLVQIGMEGSVVTKYLIDEFNTVNEALAGRRDGALPLYLVSVDEPTPGTFIPIDPITGAEGWADIRRFKPMASFGTYSDQAGSAFIAPADNITGQDLDAGTGIKRGHIQAKAIGPLQIDDAALRPAHFSADPAHKIPSYAFADGFIQSIHFSAGSVTSAAIGNGAVTNTHLATNSVGSANIINNSIISSKIAALQIQNGHLQDQAVTGIKISQTNAFDDSIAYDSGSGLWGVDVDNVSWSTGPDVSLRNKINSMLALAGDVIKHDVNGFLYLDYEEPYLEKNGSDQLTVSAAMRTLHDALSGNAGNLVFMCVGASCPTGFTDVTSIFAGRFMVGVDGGTYTTVGATGGTSTHSHSLPAHSHSIPTHKHIVPPHVHATAKAAELVPVYDDRVAANQTSSQVPAGPPPSVLQVTTKPRLYSEFSIQNSNADFAEGWSSGGQVYTDDVTLTTDAASGTTPASNHVPPWIAVRFCQMT